MKKNEYNRNMIIKIMVKNKYNKDEKKSIKILKIYANFSVI